MQEAPLCKLALRTYHTDRTFEAWTHVAAPSYHTVSPILGTSPDLFRHAHPGIRCWRLAGCSRSAGHGVLGVVILPGRFVLSLNHPRAASSMSALYVGD